MNPVVLICALTVATTCGAGEIIPGHVYVTLAEGEGCDFGGHYWILDIDPNSGDTTIFADSENDELCGATGLVFTPDKSAFRVANYGHVDSTGFIQEFDADGVGTIVLDGEDGLTGPVGTNGVAYDAAGNFYVVDGDTSEILRFPPAGGRVEVFADFFDGVFGRGALAFAPNGDLYYCSELAGEIVRFDVNGNGVLFDAPPTSVPISLVFSSEGSLFVGTQDYEFFGVYRYDEYDAESRQLIFSYYPSGSTSSPVAVGLSPDETRVYFAVPEPLYEGGYLYSIDLANGEAAVVADFSITGWFFVRPRGITVNPIPARPQCDQGGDVEGDANGDGQVDVLDSGYVLARFGCDVGAGDDDCDAADQNTDGSVDPLDVGFVLARLGTCIYR